METSPLPVGSDEKTVCDWLTAKYADMPDATKSLRLDYFKFAERLSTGGRPRNSVLSPIFRRIIDFRSNLTFNEALKRAVADVEASGGTVPRYSGTWWPVLTLATRMRMTRSIQCGRNTINTKSNITHFCLIGSRATSKHAPGHSCSNVSILRPQSSY
jgi:hypothetical protein